MLVELLVVVSYKTGGGGESRRTHISLSFQGTTLSLIKPRPQTQIYRKMRQMGRTREEERKLTSHRVMR